MSELLALILQAQDAERRYLRALADDSASNDTVGKLYTEWLALADRIEKLATDYKLPRRAVPC
jgi:hypothetical protein